MLDILQQHLHMSLPINYVRQHYYFHNNYVPVTITSFEYEGRVHLTSLCKDRHCRWRSINYRVLSCPIAITHRIAENTTSQAQITISYESWCPRNESADLIDSTQSCITWPEKSSSSGGVLCGISFIIEIVIAPAMWYFCYSVRYSNRARTRTRYLSIVTGSVVFVKAKKSDEPAPSIFQSCYSLPERSIIVKIVNFVARSWIGATFVMLLKLISSIGIFGFAVS